MNDYIDFVKLHGHNTPLLLGNVWDVPSAKIHQQKGFHALGTSSAAIADSLGYQDGEQISFEELVGVVERIKQNTSIHLSVDIESGYGDSVQDILENFGTLSKLGVVGVNLEDSIVNAERKMVPAREFSQKLKLITDGLTNSGIKMFINVRTDCYLLGLENKLTETLERVKLYEKIGANGVFVPCITEIDDIKRVADTTILPLNVMCMPDLPHFAALKKSGVKRISMGDFAYRNLKSALKTRLDSITFNQSFETFFTNDH